MTERTKTFEHKVGGRSFYFICDEDATTMEASISLCHFMKYIAQIEDACRERKLQEEQVESKTE